MGKITVDFSKSMAGKTPEQSLIKFIIYGIKEFGIFLIKIYDPPIPGRADYYSLCRRIY